MEKQLKIELRKLLTGRTIRDEEGWLIAAPEKGYFVYHGVTDRTGFRKIKMREEELQVADSNEKAFHKVFRALQDVGVLVNMQTKPDDLCALCRMLLTKSVILCVAPQSEGRVLVQAYAGRSLTAGLCCKMAIDKFAKKIEQKQ